MTTKFLTDIEIAQAATMQHITKIAEKLSIDEDDLELYGKYKAKLPLHLIELKVELLVAVIRKYCLWKISTCILQVISLQLKKQTIYYRH